MTTGRLPHFGGGRVMGLTWQDGKPYFYEWSRVGGRAVCRYVAAGDEALRLGRLAEQRRAERDQARAERAGLAAQSQQLQWAARLAGRLAGWWLEANGFHRIKRGPWRRRRNRERERGGAMDEPRS